MTDYVPEGENAKPTLGEAIDQCISALKHFNAGQQQTILQAVYAELGIAELKAETGGTGAKERDPEERSPPRKRGENEYAGMDIRAFKESKNPTSARQMACVVAYYLNEIATGEEHKEVVNRDDLEKYFKQAKYPLPNKLEQLLVDCKGSGYLEPTQRGEYKLTRVGHNLVAHGLPGKGKT
jgi:hypothetical protein